MNHYRRSETALVLPLTLMFGSCLTTAALSADTATVTAIRGSAAPILDGKADDKVWEQAPATQVSLSGGANFDRGSTQATLKAAYVGDTLYLLLQYQDPTRSVQRSPYVKQDDGAWKKLKDPNDKGGDNNKYYEDKAALIWNIDESIAGFEQAGCLTACHAGEGDKPYGNKYTDSEGELGDIWHLKTVRTGYIGQVDDQYLDHTRYDKEKSPEAGRKSDPKTGGGYTDIGLVDGTPKFMSQEAKPANDGGTYYLREEDKVPFDNSKFKPGDEVASIMVAPIAGDRGDIGAGIAWQDGQWTMEISRKLVTGSKVDVQFDELSEPYYFGLALFDNAQVRHAVARKPLKLVFEQ
jgi:hypothetical protein